MAETQVYELFIKTTPEKLWQALTDPEQTRLYFFGERIHSSWKPGAQWHSIGPKGTRDVEGKVLEADRPRRLVLSWHVLYDPELGAELSRVTYEIEQKGPLCKLTATHDLSEAPKTSSRVRGGWPLLLSSLKSLLETGEPLPAPEAAQ